MVLEDIMMRNACMLLLPLFLVCLLNGCSKNSGSPSNKGTPSDLPAASVIPRTLIDSYGREVTLPDRVSRIAAIGGAARILTYAGSADMIVGVTEMDKSNIPAMPYSIVNAERFASLASIGSGGSNDTAFIEELVMLAPDLIIGMCDSQTTVENVAEKTGIPVIGISLDNMFDESFYRSLEIIGQATGRGQHCAKVIEYVKSCQADLDARTRGIPDAEKPSVYAGAVSFRGAHGFEGTYGGYPPFTAIHARNVVDETGQKGTMLIDLEKVTVWDPDIIFLNPSNMNLVNDDYAKNPVFYDNLKAVKNGNIYTQISYNYNWSNLEIAIADTYYAGKIMFPHAFTDIDPIAKADEIFTVMLGEPFYDKLAAAGLRFEKMTIGGQG
jgi:iron complex transport system substrate-binding protein